MTDVAAEPMNCHYPRTPKILPLLLILLLSSTASLAPWGQVTAQTPPQPQLTTEQKAALAEAERLNQQVLQLYQQGKYAEAVPLAEQALSICRRVLGESHPDVATSLNNLALLYQDQGRYAAAAPLYQRSLQIRETQLGKDHPAVATSLNNLAELYRAQGLYAAAAPLSQLCFQILNPAGLFPSRCGHQPQQSGITLPCPGALRCGRTPLPTQLADL